MAELILWKNQEIDRLKKDMDRLLNASGMTSVHPCC